MPVSRPTRTRAPHIGAVPRPPEETVFTVSHTLRAFLAADALRETVRATESAGVCLPTPLVAVLLALTVAQLEGRAASVRLLTCDRTKRRHLADALCAVDRTSTAISHATDVVVRHFTAPNH